MPHGGRHSLEREPRDDAISLPPARDRKAGFKVGRIAELNDQPGVPQGFLQARCHVGIQLQGKESPFGAHPCQQVACDAAGARPEFDD